MWVVHYDYSAWLIVDCEYPEGFRLYFVGTGVFRRCVAVYHKESLNDS